VDTSADTRIAIGTGAIEHRLLLDGQQSRDLGTELAQRDG